MTGSGSCHSPCLAQESVGPVTVMFQQERRAINMAQGGGGISQARNSPSLPPAKLQSRPVARDIEHESHLPD